MWVHTTGGNTPAFNASGHVTGPGPNTTRDLLDFVREAQSRNILVTFSLWNAAALTLGEFLFLYKHPLGKYYFVVVNVLIMCFVTGLVFLVYVCP